MDVLPTITGAAEVDDSWLRMPTSTREATYILAIS